MRKRKKQGDERAPWHERPAVVCADGQLARRWYFADDFDRMRAAALRMERDWPYEPAGETRPHPDYPGTRGVVHRLRPGVVVPAAGPLVRELDRPAP